MSYPSWQYEELKQVGKDYADPTEAEHDDSRHSQFRNVERDSELILDALDPFPGSVPNGTDLSKSTCLPRSPHGEFQYPTAHKECPTEQVGKRGTRQPT